MKLLAVDLADLASNGVADADHNGHALDTDCAEAAAADDDEDPLIKVGSEVIIYATESVHSGDDSAVDDVAPYLSVGDECAVDHQTVDIKLEPTVADDDEDDERVLSTREPKPIARTDSFESSGCGSASYVTALEETAETASVRSDTGSSSESGVSSLCLTRPTGGGALSAGKDGQKESPACGCESVCRWTFGGCHCDWPGNYDDLVDHIREIHVELQPYQPQRQNAGANPNTATGKKSAAEKKCETSSSVYVCLWEGCKVYGKSSLSRNWLERHALQHSGPRPFKCIVERCGARFKTQSALERHVNSHFKPSPDSSGNSTNGWCEGPFLSCSGAPPLGLNCSTASANSDSSQGMSPFELHLQQSSHATMMRVKADTGLANGVPATGGGGHCVGSGFANGNGHHQHYQQNGGGGNGTPNKILKRKKSTTKLKRKCVIVKCSEDFFDEFVMEQVRYGLIQLNSQTGLDISTQTAITFHSKVIARRKNDSGEVNLLLKWEPNDIIPDVWVTEPEMSSLKSKTIPISLLPAECLAQLTELTSDRHRYATDGDDDGNHNDEHERKPKTKQRRK